MAGNGSLHYRLECGGTRGPTNRPRSKTTGRAAAARDPGDRGERKRCGDIVICNTACAALSDGDRVGEVDRGACSPTASPTCRSSTTTGASIGLFKLDRLLRLAAAEGGADRLRRSRPRVHLGLPWPSCASGCARSRTEPVRHFAVKPDHVVHPDTSPMEVVMLLYKGANNVPVVDRDSGRLVGMVSARDVLAALQATEADHARRRAARLDGDLRLEPAVGGDAPVRAHLRDHHEREAQSRDHRADRRRPRHPARASPSRRRRWARSISTPSGCCWG